MSSHDLAYHRQREKHCREMAEGASNPEVRRRHEELASLHASEAARCQASASVLGSGGSPQFA